LVIEEKEKRITPEAIELAKKIINELEEVEREIWENTKKEVYKFMRENPRGFRIAYRLLKNMLEIQDPQVQFWFEVTRAYLNFPNELFNLLFGKRESNEDEKKEVPLSKLIRKLISGGLL